MKKICFCFLLYSFLACNLKEKKLVEKHFDDGILKAEAYINDKDTVFDGKAWYYYKNGALKDSFNYHNNKKNGWSYSFFENRTLSQKVFFKNDTIQNGSFYYPDGKIKSNVFYKNGKAIFIEEFFLNGKRKIYNVFLPDKTDSIQFVTLFDSATGKKFYENGYVFSKNPTYSNGSNSVEVNKPISISFFCTQIPEYQTIIVTKQLEKNQINKVDTLIPKNFYAKYNFVSSSKGIKHLVVIGILTNKDQTIVTKDSLDLFINVL